MTDGRSLFARLFGNRAARRAERAVAEQKRAAGELFRELMAGYDASEPDAQNEEHWRRADLLSADAWASPSKRAEVRARARYEGVNNGFLRGILRTNAAYIVGAGPKLALTIPTPAGAGDAARAAARDSARAIELEFARWASAVDLASNLLLALEARPRDGEVFCLLATNPGVAHPVKLDLRLVEADLVASDDGVSDDDPRRADGVEYDAHGNPARYFILDEHPGAFVSTGKGRFFLARWVIHDFIPDRPGQRRGVSEIAPSLSISAKLRRLIEASLTAAEIAASIGGIIKGPPPSQETDGESSIIDLRPGEFMGIPGGDLQQIKSEHPSTTFDAFARMLVNQVARPLDMPRNIALGDSTGLNYSSGKLDHQAYRRRIDIERARLVRVWLDRIFAEWWAEAVDRLRDLIPVRARDLDSVRVEWRFDGFMQIDPAKEASAVETQLRSGMTSRTIEYAKRGLDFEEVTRERARERDLLRELDLDFDAEQAPAASAALAAIDAEGEA